MIKIVYFLLALGFLFLNPVYSYYDADVPADFKAMLKNPTTGHPGEHLATRVTRPFIKEPAKDVNFFSDPKTHRPQWDTANESAIKPIDIFNTMGISRRGLSNDAQHARYKRITDAQAVGMLRVVSGQAFGLKGTVATAAEQNIMAKELLNIGHLMDGNVLAEKLADLRAAYGRLSVLAKKRHTQMSALLMLRGANLEIKDGEWYLKDGINKANALKKVDRYAAAFLPPDERPEDGAAAAAEVHFDPATIHLKHLSRGPFLYGTEGVQPSKIHSDAAGARFLNVMGLGTMKTPANTQSVDDVCSIVAQVNDTHSIVITYTPELRDADDAFVVLPAYMEIDPSKALQKKFNKGRMAEEVLQGNVSVSIASQFVNPIPTPISWSTAYAANTGQLTFKKAPPAAFSFTATVAGQAKKPKTFYYLRVPVGIKMALNTFSGLKGDGFTLLELLDEITSSISEASILAELEQIKKGNFPKL